MTDRYWSNKPGWPSARVGRRHADVPVGGRHRHAAAWRAGDHALLDEERLVHVLDRLGLLADADRQRRQPDRPAAELLAQRGEHRPVDLVEPEVVDAEQRQAVAGDVGGDRAVARAPRRSRAPGAAGGWRCGACRASGGRSPRRRRRRSRRSMIAGRARDDLLQLVVVVVVEPGDEPEPVAQRPGDHAGAGGGADEREAAASSAGCSTPPDPCRRTMSSWKSSIAG